LHKQGFRVILQSCVQLWLKIERFHLIPIKNLFITSKKLINLKEGAKLVNFSFIYSLESSYFVQKDKNRANSIYKP